MDPVTLGWTRSHLGWSGLHGPPSSPAPVLHQPMALTVRDGRTADEYAELPRLPAPAGNPMRPFMEELQL